MICFDLTLISHCPSCPSVAKPAGGKKEFSGTPDKVNTEASKVGGIAEESASKQTTKNLNDSTVAVGQPTENEKKSSKKKKKRKRSRGNSAADSELPSSSKKPK